MSRALLLGGRVRNAFAPASAHPKNATSSPPPNFHAVQGNGRNLIRRLPCGVRRVLYRAELQVQRASEETHRNWRDLNPRPRRYQRSIRSLHHLRGNWLCRGTFENRTTSANAGPCDPKARDTTLLPERLHGTMQTPFSASMGDLLAKYLSSSPPTNCFPGERATRLVSRRSPRLHHLEFETLLLFPNDKSFEEAGNKNPSGASAREGFEKTNT